MTAPVPIEIATDGAVRIVRMNRPDKKNALTAAMYGALAAALGEAGADPAINAVLILGTPGAFSAGNDLNDFVAAALGNRQGNEVFDFLKALAEAPKPLIAGVDGIAVGVGVTMLFHCDHVVASDRAVFRAPFVDLGIIPEAASTLLAPRLMGHHRAFELLVMGRPFDAAAAERAGFVNAVVPADGLEAAALAVAREIAAKPPGGVAAARRLMRAPASETVPRLMEEGRIFRERLTSDEARAAFQAFFARR